MTGVQFVVDDQGEKQAVLIDLRSEKNRELWEDIYDAAIAAERADEPRVNLTDAKRSNGCESPEPPPVPSRVFEDADGDG